MDGDSWALFYITVYVVAALLILQCISEGEGGGEGEFGAENIPHPIDLT